MKATSSEALHEMFRWIHRKSLKDQRFSRQLHKEQRTQDYARLITRRLGEVVSSFTVKWKLSAARRSQGDLRRMIPSESNILHKLRDGYEDGGVRNPKLEPYTIRTVAAAARGWMAEWRDWFVTDEEEIMNMTPDLHDDVLNGTFKELLDKDSWFYLITPITDKKHLQNLHAKFEDEGWGQMPVGEMLELTNGDSGWHACTCNEFQHKMLCAHVIVDAFKKNLLTSFPPGMRVERLSGTGAGNGAIRGAGAGRLSNARRGGALGTA